MAVKKGKREKVVRFRERVFVYVKWLFWFVFVYDEVNVSASSSPYLAFLYIINFFLLIL